jgi:PhzF family phenazine biosynthesis protein
MKLPLYWLDAFSSRQFHGNPAAVVPLDRWLDERTMQSIAAENNLAETAFLVREPAGWHIRWFTPTVEMDLCGHATLASAHVVFEKLDPAAPSVTFASRSGPLVVTRDGERLCLEFPARPARPCEPPALMIEGLGIRPRETYLASDLLAVFDHEDQVRAIIPKLDRLAAIEEARGVIVTAPGTDVDFVSRFFAPKVGVDEDPVTGSAHCTLIPYWAGKLGRTTLRARQISSRGGELWCELRGDRVRMAGEVAPYLEGTITIPSA